MASASIAFIGGGNMASSIIGGLVAKGFSPKRIIVSDPSAESLQRLRKVAPVKVTHDNAEAVAGADVVVLAVKPQVMKSVVESIASTVSATQPLIISIAAGIEVASLQRWFATPRAIVRCMPNTPALVQSGATALFANAQVNEDQHQLATTILRAVGIALWVDDEAQLDAVTAVSGSGPAYFFLVMEAMQAAGEKMGLAPDMVRQLTLQTALGAAQMAISSDVGAEELRRRVTSPGGTTERAVACFEEGGLRTLFESALNAARDRSMALARELGDTE